MAHFTPSLFDFLEELAANNRRDWFQANKQRYRTDVQDPLLRFVTDFEDRLASISPHMVADARRSGGSVFRIYRDIRFSKDKTPYKTNAGVHFRHEAGRDVHGPGLYLHLEPGMVFAGAGTWRPNATTAGKIREAIVEDPDGWSGIVEEPDFASTFTLEAESLKRTPRGFDPGHPLIDYLKLKSFAATTSFSEEETCAQDFIDLYTDTCRVAAPFTGFLTAALGLAW